MSNQASKPKLNLKQSLSKLVIARKYLWIGLALFLVVSYGYVVIKINGFVQQQPTTTQVAQYLKNQANPSVNPKIVSQLEQLQNHSVSVQALFNQARQNPFQ